jgi:hypothetical protein
MLIAMSEYKGVFVVAGVVVVLVLLYLLLPVFGEVLRQSPMGWWFFSEYEARQIYGNRRERILDYVDPVAAAVFGGINTGDYGQFTTEFSEKYKQIRTERQFQQERARILERFGACGSFEVINVEEWWRTEVAVNYAVDFEKEQDVLVHFIFEMAPRSRHVKSVSFDYHEQRQWKDLPLTFGAPETEGTNPQEGL